MVTALAILSITDRIELWHLIVGAFVTGSVITFDQPSQQALFPRLLPDRPQLANAVPLIGVAWDFNRIISRPSPDSSSTPEALEPAFS